MVHAIRSATRVLLPAFTAALPAQIPIGGALSGTLAAGVYHATSNLSVATGQTLVLSAGVIIKFNGQQFTVAGTLLANGTAANPVVLTHIQDDSAGGDTNGNGPSVGTPGGWVTLRLDDTADASVLDYTEVRFGGHNFTANAELFACDATFRHCRFANGYSQGIDLNETSRPTVTDCTFTGNGAVAVERAPITALPGFAGNNATGNAGGTGNYVQVTDGDVAADLTIGPGAMISGAIVVAATIDVAAGATLTIAAGTILKFAGVYNVHVIGTLRATGTAADPVILTHIQDDSAGGDTNGNGPSAGTPGSWSGLRLEDTADASVLDHTEVRYGGYNFVANAELFACDATFRHCRFANGYSQGIDLNETSRPTVTDCTFAGNGAVAIERAAIAAIPGFANNTATGNGGNYVDITEAVVSGSLRIGPQAVMNGALVLSTNLTVPAGAVLTIEQGVTFKFASVQSVVVDGAVWFLGTSYEPIVFTALADDQYGGDTNGNGASSGAPSSWVRVWLRNGTSVSRLENVVVRYAGYNYAPGLDCESPFVALVAVRVDRCYARGFELDIVAGNPTNLVAWANGSDGIWVGNGRFDLRHATAAGNATGIRRGTRWTGTVVNSISWGNSVNFASFTAPQVFYSDGFAGGSGNLNVDPQFVDLAGGDLHLAAGSPCLDVASLGYGVSATKDFDENSRVTDQSLTGLSLPDMGAFERQVWDMTVAGTPRPGATVTFQVDGPPGLSFWCWGTLDATLPFLPYGIVLVGIPGQSLVLLLPYPVTTATPVPLPLVNDPSLIGAIAGFQTLTFPAASAAYGNLTRLYRGLVRP